MNGAEKRFIHLITKVKETKNLHDKVQANGCYVNFIYLKFYRGKRLNHLIWIKLCAILDLNLEQLLSFV